MTDTTAKIRAKGCESTGLTEELARKLWDAGAGNSLVAIVELRVVTPHGPDTEGKRQVDLTIEHLEPVVDGNLNGRLVDHVRTLQQALYRNRKLHENGEELPLDGDGEAEPIEQIVDQGKAQLDHDDDGPKLYDPEADDEDGGEPTPDDPSYEPHEFVDGPDALCQHEDCGQPAGAAVHQEVPVPA